MNNKNILISGAGVAGLTLAYWLKRFGFSPILVERSKNLRLGGYKVDIRGVALEVVKRMGIHHLIHEKQTHMKGASIVDNEGRIVAEVDGEAFNLRSAGDLEIFRGDLCQILKEQIPDVNCIFGDSIRAISKVSNGVRVDFEKSESQIFDLIIGADGLHSHVRKLVFGEETNFAKGLGMCISIYSVPNFLSLDGWEMECSENGRLVNLYSAKKNTDAKAAFLFTTPYSPRNLAEQQGLLENTYAEMGWEVPRLLSSMKKTPDFYFDSVSQIHMDLWHRDRIALVGDAGYCASPVSGQGTSLALVGAYILAGELAFSEGDYSKAFVHYERLMRLFVQKNQKLGQVFAKNMTHPKRKIVSWLHDQLMLILPNQWINCLTNRSVKRVNFAANAITLKDYLS